MNLMAKRRDLPPNFHSHEYGGTEAPAPFLLMPAYTVLPFIRSPLGYEIVRILPALRRTLGLIVLPVIAEALWVGFTHAQLPANMGHVYLSDFALAYLVADFIIFARRWSGQRSGEKLHSAEAGYSWLAWYTTLPVVTCELVAAPGALLLLGEVFHRTVSIELGWWLRLAAASLLLMGWWEHRRVWSQQRATTDDLVRAKAFDARVDRSGVHQATPSTPTEPPDFADLA